MGPLENSTAVRLASQPYPKYVEIEQINDNNSLDFPDSFSILKIEFKFSDKP